MTPEEEAALKALEAEKLKTEAIKLAEEAARKAANEAAMKVIQDAALDAAKKAAEESLRKSNITCPVVVERKTTTLEKWLITAVVLMFIGGIWMWVYTTRDGRRIAVPVDQV